MCAAGSSFRRDAFGEGFVILDAPPEVGRLLGQEFDRVGLGNILAWKEMRAGMHAVAPDRLDRRVQLDRRDHPIPVAPLFCRFDTDGRPFFEFEHGR